MVTFVIYVNIVHVVSKSFISGYYTQRILILEGLAA